jgi:hypothetical protein
MEFETSPAAKTLVRAASKVTLVRAACPFARELGYSKAVLDEVATLRRVALFYRGTGSYRFTPEEKFLALDVIRGRWDEGYEARVAQQR